MSYSLSIDVCHTLCPSPSVLLFVLRHLSYSLSFAICPTLCPSPSVLLSVLRHLSYSLSFAICPTLCPSPSVLLSVIRHLSYSLFFAICPTLCHSPSVLLSNPNRTFGPIRVDLRRFAEDESLRQAQAPERNVQPVGAGAAWRVGGCRKACSGTFVCGTRLCQQIFSKRRRHVTWK